MKLLLIAFLFLFVSCQSKDGQAPPEVRQLSRLENEYLSNYAKAHDMEFVRVGNFTETQKNIFFGAWFQSSLPVLLEEGRIVAAKLLKGYLETFKDHPLTKENIEKHWTRLFWVDKIGIKNFAIKIAYWDKQFHRPPMPYLAEITFYDNSFNYYQADPETEALCLIYQESYEEAMENLQKNEP